MLGRCAACGLVFLISFGYAGQDAASKTQPRSMNVNGHCGATSIGPETLTENSFMTTSKPKDIEEYIAMFPLDIQESLEQIRAIIKKVVPEAEETISYGMPTFNLNGTYLIYFAAYKNHIGLYPVPGAIRQVDKDFGSYKTSGKGTIQFPLNKPIPLDLITKLVKFKVKENVERVAKNRKARKSTNL